MFSSLTKANLSLKAFGFFKIPLIFFCRPQIVELSATRIVVRIALRRRTKNHLNSMYFGALAVGADVSGALIAFNLMKEKNIQASLVFKDLKAEFLKRPMGDVHFTCEDGALIGELIDEAQKNKQRAERVVNVVATVPKINPNDPVARFWLTLSVKVK